MPLPKPLSKEQIIAAQAKTKSNAAAARYLHVSYGHYKRYAKNYNLFESHKNQSGKGIPKFLNNGKKDPALLDIIEGRVSSAHFSPEKIKYRLIEEGYLAEECSVCKFTERRVLDYKMPLLLHFKDKNKSNYSQDNIELLCYNHFFLLVGDIFTDKDVQQIESHQELNSTTNAVNWEIDDYHLQRLKELGLEDEDDTHQYISRI
jgi:transposase